MFLMIEAQFRSTLDDFDWFWKLNNPVFFISQRHWVWPDLFTVVEQKKASILSLGWYNYRNCCKQTSSWSMLMSNLHLTLVALLIPGFACRPLPLIDKTLLHVHCKENTVLLPHAASVNLNSLNGRKGTGEKVHAAWKCDEVLWEDFQATLSTSLCQRLSPTAAGPQSLGDSINWFKTLEHKSAEKFYKIRQKVIVLEQETFCMILWNLPWNCK